MEGLALQIRGHIARYLAGKSDLRDLHRSLALAAWEIEQHASKETADLARAAQLAIDEFAHGDWTEEEFRSRLRGILGVVGDWQPVAQTASGSAVVVCNVEWSLAPA